MLLSGPSWSYYLVQVGCVLKNANLDQIITFKFLARNFFFKKKGWNPYFYSVFWQSVFYKKSKLGPDNNFQKGQTWTR